MRKKKTMAYTHTYDIPYFLVDRHRKLRVTALMQFLEDMAIRHSEVCGVGLDHYEENQVAWVLAKWDITIHSYPGFNQQVHVTTQPVSFRNFFGFRQYKMKDDNGTLLAEASSLWIFIDLKKKKPVRVSEEMINAFGLTPDQNKPLPIKAPEAPEKKQYESRFAIRPGDIDTNKHANNIRFVEWALNTLPPELIDGKRATRVMVDYRKELLYGEEVFSFADFFEDKSGYISNHLISNGQKNACLLTFMWKET
ncbi:acyl-[acyl-carrier-protein] thioesterase [Natronogracilivirga saccharolytica]|uniref:acyl-[acyl-carrier-protein] thioesterase n=1 Tax=Natronogracilivirga saccharolytica TaxID=2812953 RepID=UPI001B303F91